MDDATAPDLNWYIEHLTADTAALAVAVTRGPTDSPIEACSGWNVADLAGHLGFIHRWARSCVINGEMPTEVDGFKADDTTDLAPWLLEGAAELAAALRDLDPRASTWHPFPVERVGAVWPRRMAHETAVHRWDAERAIGEPNPIDPALAGDGIDEYFELAVPRLATREHITVPSGSLHVHCTDVPGEWLVWSDDDGYHLVREHQKGDAALRGPAEAILLRLWGRSSARADELSPVGDERVLDAWLALAGM